MVYFLVVALLAAALFVVYAARSVGVGRRWIENWANPPPPIDLATNKLFQSFLQFHGTVCDMWNEVVQKSMDSDQTTLSKAAYIQQMEQSIQPPMTLIQCASTLSATTDPATLLQEIPTTIDPYKNTLTFLVTKTTSMLTKLEGALQGNIEQFAPYQATVSCDPLTQTCQGSNITCSISGDAVDASGNANNQVLLQQVLDRIAPILEGESDIQPLYSQAQTNIAKLKEYSGKAQDGSLVNDVNIPSS
jgi:hypothetical protein